MLKADLEALLLREEQFWAQRAGSRRRCRYKIFHGVANGRELKSQITKFHDRNGNVVEDINEIVNYFQKLFKKRIISMFGLKTLNRHQLMKQDSTDLKISLSIEEIKRSVFCSARDKSPCGDGFSMNFLFLSIQIVQQM